MKTKTSNPFKDSAIWLEDNSHAWLCIPRSLLKDYKVENKISSHSYQRNHPDGTPVVFLEEDCDATTFINAVGVWKYKIADGNGWIKTLTIPETKEHFVRDADSYTV